MHLRDHLRLNPFLITASTRTLATMPQTRLLTK
jgi:hypothetical protein